VSPLPVIQLRYLSPCHFNLFGYGPSASGMQHPQQVQFFPDPSLPPGQGDLEALERLKEFIKNNQHEIFRAVPRPAALANLYKGALPSPVPPYPEQTSSSLREKPTTTQSGIGYEIPSSSSFSSDGHHPHIASAVQGATLIGSPGGDSVPSRPGISSDKVCTSFRPIYPHSLILTICSPSLRWILLTRVGS
jgi:hypothetical protein